MAAGDQGGDWLSAGRVIRRAHRLAVIRQAASVLIGRPGQAFFESLPLVARAVAELPRGAVRVALQEFCAHVSVTPERDLREHHAAVFDPRGHWTLHMTRYSTDDARRRSRALAEVRRVYADAGWPAPADEPPDHLAVVLEFAARGHSRGGELLLERFRPGLELLGDALYDHGTPYAGVVDAILRTLPAQGREEPALVRRLNAQDPSTENAGLEPYGVRVRSPHST